jgi:hypothetical protein
VKTQNPIVPDVRAAFANIRERGHFLGARDGNKFTDPRYTASFKNNGGLGNHFQGIVRLGKHVVISGGDKHADTRSSHLFVVEMHSRKRDEPFRSNLWHETTPPEDDKVIKAIDIDKRYWHAGGIAATGDLLAVPIEHESKSRIVFFDFSRPASPVQLNAVLDRPKHAAGAVAITSLADGRLLLAAYTGGRLDLYLSTDATPDGFGSPIAATIPKEFAKAGYQGIDLVRQNDGALFLVGTRNTSDAAPTVPGSDMAELWAVTLNDSAAPVNPAALSTASVARLTSRKFKAKDRQANMDAGAGIYIDAAGALHLYSCYHWRQDNIIRFLEFRAKPPATLPPVTSRDEAWIDMFEHADFGGHCLSLSGGTKVGTHIDDYRSVHVEGNDFNDQVSSLRFQIPIGHTYELFEHRDYGGNILPLRGEGHVVEYRDIHTLPNVPHLANLQFGDRVSSSRWA